MPLSGLSSNCIDHEHSDGGKDDPHLAVTKRDHNCHSTGKKAEPPINGESGKLSLGAVDHLSDVEPGPCHKAIERVLSNSKVECDATSGINDVDSNKMCHIVGPGAVRQSVDRLKKL